MANEFQLGGIVPWGRTASEYEAFFALAHARASRRVLDCGGGPSSFAAEWARRGHRTVSVDPLYARSPAQIAADFEPTASRMLQGMRDARARFNWEYYGSPEAVVEKRREALRTFLADRNAPVRAARYVAGRLPALPFADDSFDLVLCSHLLFLYSDELGLDEHLAALREMLRVGAEVRVFPLVDLHGQPSRHLEPVVEWFRPYGSCEIIPVDFEFQRGATRMLRLSRPTAA